MQHDDNWKGEKMNAERIKPSRWYYGLAILLFLIGASLFGLFILKNLIGLSRSLVQLAVPGTYDLTFSDIGRYTIFYEYQTVIGGRIYATRPSLSGLRCELQSKETGTRVRLSAASISTTYSLGSRSGVSVLDFHVDSPGSYEFSAWYPEGQEGPEIVLAIGYGFTKRIIRTVLGGLGLFFGTVGVSVGVALITLFKRRKVREGLGGNPSNRSVRATSQNRPPGIHHGGPGM